MSIIGRAIRTLVSVVIKTVTGAFVSFSDAKAGEAFKAVVADIASAATGVKVYQAGKNLLKSVNGTAQLTSRTVTVSNGVITCNMTAGGASSAVVANAASFDSSFYLPAGTYYFALNFSSQYFTATNPFLRFTGKSGTTYDKGEGAFTLTEPARITQIRNSQNWTVSNGKSYTAKPVISLASGEAFVAPDIIAHSVSWSSVAGSVSSGEINLTTGVLTSGGNTYQLTPTAITARSGINNMWADTGDITVGYIAE